MRGSWNSLSVFGATAIDATAGDPVGQIRELTNGRGVDVALELIGLPVTMGQAVQSLATLGRAALVGLTQETFELAPYRELINKEAEVIGVSDHLACGDSGDTRFGPERAARFSERNYSDDSAGSGCGKQSFGRPGSVWQRRSDRYRPMNPEKAGHPQITQISGTLIAHLGERFGIWNLARNPGRDC